MRQNVEIQPPAQKLICYCFVSFLSSYLGIHISHVILHFCKVTWQKLESVAMHTTKQSSCLLPVICCTWNGWAGRLAEVAQCGQNCPHFLSYHKKGSEYSRQSFSSQVPSHPEQGAPSDWYGCFVDQSTLHKGTIVQVNVTFPYRVCSFWGRPYQQSTWKVCHLLFY